MVLILIRDRTSFGTVGMAGSDNGSKLEDVQNRPKATSPEPKEKDEKDTAEEQQPRKNLFASLFDLFVGWLTPYEQMMVLRREKQDGLWERFRDSLMRKWSGMNIIVSVFCLRPYVSVSELYSAVQFAHGVSGSIGLSR